MRKSQSITYDSLAMQIPSELVSPRKDESVEDEDYDDDERVEDEDSEEEVAEEVILEDTGV